MKRFFVALLFVVLAAVIFWQQQRTRHLTEETAGLREQLAQAASLQAETQRLTGQLKAAEERSGAEKDELLRLRGQTATLRRTEEENARLRAERDRLAKQTGQPTPAQPQDDPRGPSGHAKVLHARNWGYALRNYADNHQGQFPASFEQAAPFLLDGLSAEAKAQTIQTADQFEILYHGLMDDLDNLAPESTIIVREKQPWVDQQGRWCKAYCSAEGGSFIHNSSNNDFERWESIRIPKPK